MSVRALLLGLRDHLCSPTPFSTLPTATVDTGLGFKRGSECEVMPDGQPAPMSGEFFVAIWEATWNGNSTECLDENIGVRITVTKRLPRVPFDRIGPEIMAKATVGLLSLAEAIRASVHLNYVGVMARVNAYIANESRLVASNGVGQANGFVEPLFFQDGSGTEKKSGAWFWADEQERLAGITKTLTMNPARRVQRADIQT